MSVSCAATSRSWPAHRISQPALSTALSPLLLRAPLSLAFSQGAVMACGGAILSWLAGDAHEGTGRCGCVKGGTKTSMIIKSSKMTDWQT